MAMMPPVSQRVAIIKKKITDSVCIWCASLFTFFVPTLIFISIFTQTVFGWLSIQTNRKATPNHSHSIILKERPSNGRSSMKIIFFNKTIQWEFLGAHAQPNKNDNKWRWDQTKRMKEREREENYNNQQKKFTKIDRVQFDNIKITKQKINNQMKLKRKKTYKQIRDLISLGRRTISSDINARTVCSLVFIPTLNWYWWN